MANYFLKKSEIFHILHILHVSVHNYQRQEKSTKTKVGEKPDFPVLFFEPGGCQTLSLLPNFVYKVLMKHGYQFFYI